MKLMKFKVLWLAFFLPSLTSCCDDDEGYTQEAPLTFSAVIANEGMTDTEQWDGMLDRRIAVQINGVVKKYMIDAQGNLTSSEPFYGQNREMVTVDAWYPYNNGVKQTTVEVKAEQNIPAYYQASNLMEVVATQVTQEENKLVFLHRTTKLVCNLALTKKPETRADGLEMDLIGARISLLNLSGVEGGTRVNMNADYKAYIVAQTIPVGTEFMEIKLKDGRSYIYVMEKEFNPSEGIMYDMKVEISPDTGLITLSINESPVWEGDEEDIPIDTPITNPDSDSSWNGGGSSNDVNGDSSNTNPGGDGSWNGEGSSNEVSGDSSDTNPGGDGSWNGEGSGEDVNGDSSNTNPGGNSSWNGEGSGEDVNGDSSNVNPGGNGSWNGEGSGENVSGDSSNTSPGGNGSWNGEGNGEDVNGNSPDTNSDNSSGSWEGGSGETITGTKKEETPTTAEGN